MSYIDTSSVIGVYNALYGGVLSRAPLDATSLVDLAVSRVAEGSGVVPREPFNPVATPLLSPYQDLSPTLVDPFENGTLATAGGPVGAMLDSYYATYSAAVEEKTLLEGATLDIQG